MVDHGIVPLVARADHTRMTLAQTAVRPDPGPRWAELAEPAPLALVGATGDAALMVIVDANRTVRKGTELLLRAWGHHVIGTADDVERALVLIRRRRPNVVLVDAELPQR